jgi:hypothetical protein
MIDSTQIFDGTLGLGTLNPQQSGYVSGVTGAAITASRVSTNVLDLLVPRDYGAGEPLGVHVDVTTAFATLTSLTIDLEICATVGGTYLSIISSPVIPVAQLIAGAPIFRYALPVNQLLNGTAGVLATPGRYVRLNYTVAGSSATAGAVFSFVNPRQDRQEFWVPPNNYTVTVDSGEV